MHATLLIKNIDRLYTCNKDFEIIENAFLALYHDKIIAVSTGSYQEYLDPCTCIIDATGEIVVPAFIDCHFLESKKEMTGDKLREENNALYTMYKNGILTVYNTNREKKELIQDLVKNDKEPTLPIISYSSNLEHVEDGEFCLSCGFGEEGILAYSLQPLAHDLVRLLHIKPLKALCAMTRFPACACGLKDRGSIEIGKIGDILVLRTSDVETYFNTVGDNCIHRMIKNGIPVFPTIKRC